MKIAIPMSQGILCPHFGHCEIFSIIETDEKGIIISKTDLVPPEHEPGVLPAWLNSLGVNHIIAGGMGSRAQDLFFDNNISVIVGAPQIKPEELVELFINGTLTSGDNVCDH